MEGIWLIFEVFKEPLKEMVNKIFKIKEKKELTEESIRNVVRECLNQNAFENLSSTRREEISEDFEVIIQNSLLNSNSEVMQDEFTLDELLQALEGILIYPSTEDTVIVIPPGKLATETDQVKKLREEIKKKLLEGKKVTISPTGKVNPNDTTSNNITIPPGKLASFYWYERDKDLFNAEVAAMSRYFPAFKLQKLETGHLCWQGVIETGIGYSPWHLLVMYDHNHPSNDSYGGSIKIYSLEPDLEQYKATIPHLLRDANQQIYLCTARKEDVNANTVISNVGKVTTTAASSLAWAVKWITVFELWVSEKITLNQFQEHTF
jgi:hypothetical protein